MRAWWLQCQAILSTGRQLERNQKSITAFLFALGTRFHQRMMVKMKKASLPRLADGWLATNLFSLPSELCCTHVQALMGCMKISYSFLERDGRPCQRSCHGGKPYALWARAKSSTNLDQVLHLFCPSMCDYQYTLEVHVDSVVSHLSF